MQGDQVSVCVEALCETGCGSVRAVIRNLEQGLPVAEARDLSEEQRRAVLDELKAIMSVYDSDRCPS